MCKKNKKTSHEHFGLFATKSPHYLQPTTISLAQQVRRPDKHTSSSEKDRSKLSNVPVLK